MARKRHTIVLDKSRYRRLGHPDRGSEDVEIQVERYEVSELALAQVVVESAKVRLRKVVELRGDPAFASD